MDKEHTCYQQRYNMHFHEICLQFDIPERKTNIQLRINTDFTLVKNK